MIDLEWKQEKQDFKTNLKAVADDKNAIIKQIEDAKDKVEDLSNELS